MRSGSEWHFATDDPLVSSNPSSFQPAIPPIIFFTGRIAAGYFDHEGTPQSDQIKTVERFIPNADYSRLDYTLTTTDPVNPYECLDRFEPGK